MGTLIRPPDMYIVLAAELMTWSIACIEKLNVMNSRMGLSPWKAAPTARPEKPISVMGVSMTLLSPYFFHRPRVTL